MITIAIIGSLAAATFITNLIRVTLNFGLPDAKCLRFLKAEKARQILRDYAFVRGLLQINAGQVKPEGTDLKVADVKLTTE